MMPKHTSSAVVSREQLRERVLDLLWSLWAELGVPGWTRRHQNWAIDPEPLILFTALVGESDPRLRDESINWCARNARFIASTRLRNLLRSAPSALKDRWGTYAATVNAHGGVAWPDASEPLVLKSSVKTGLDDFRLRALISLRLRTTLGVSARSEILLYFVAHPDARAAAADLSAVVHYSKRNVEKELEALRKAGLLDTERRRNRLEHFVVRPESLLLFAGERPDYFPRWDAIFTVLTALLHFDARSDTMEPRVAAVEGRSLLRDLAGAVREADLPEPPTEVTGLQLSTALDAWGANLADTLAQGDVTRLGWAKATPVARPEPRQDHPKGVRGIVSPLLATATDLAVWAGTRAAQGHVPELVRGLVRATTNELVRIDMVSGDAIQYGGYDGVVEAASASPFVPTGRSVWEIGVSADVKGKADSDYEKRTANPNGIDPAATTFVFVTPRRWASKRAWEKEHREQGVWRDVRVLDADDLEMWLGRAPVVHAWLSALLGKSWGSVQDLTSYWLDWSEATAPPLSAELVLAGRREAADELRKRVEQPSTVIRVQGDSLDEALAFIATALHGMEHADEILAQSLVVQDTEGWNWAAMTDTPLVLIPRFEHPSTAVAIRHGHRVIIPVGREAAAPDDLVLPRLRRDPVKTALLDMGVPGREADNLAGLGRANLTSLRRKLALDKGLQQPVWTHRVEAPALLPALIAGAWDETKTGDQEVLTTLAERPYEDVERSLTRWAEASDPPVRKVGGSWFLVSKEDAWDLLASNLTRNDLARFREALVRALGIQDPANKLPPEKRWMANVLGYEHPLSGYLREGLVDTLAIMGARSGENPFLTGQTGQSHANVIVRDVLERANSDESGELWVSLAWVLPLLAEAAPDELLDAIDTALSRQPSPLVSLFTDADQPAALFASSPHVGLLWALENLAWSPDFLGRSIQQLATLRRLDPGGQLANRPSSSLRSVFLIWHPQTAAPLRDRLAALDNLRRKEPDVAWELMLAMLPKPHDVATPSHEPRWRDWKDTWQAGVTFEERDEAVRKVTDRLLADVGISGKRWAQVIQDITNLPWSRVIETLEDTDPAAFAEEDRTTVWTALRSEIANGRGFADADWALPAQAIDRLEQVYTRLTPSDPIRREAWLFGQRPDLLDGEQRDWASYQQAIENARRNAVRKLRENEGLAALLSLARVVEQPGEVGRVMGETASPESGDEQVRLLDLLDSPDDGDQLLARGYVVGRLKVGGREWARAVLENVAPTWTPVKRGAFLSALSFGPETWEWLQRFGAETERAYWSMVPAGWLEDTNSAEQAATRLIQVGRAGDAVDLLAMVSHRGSQEIDPDLVARALEELLHQEGARRRSNLGYDVATLFEYLDKSEAIGMSRLAQLEWGYLPLLEGGRRAPKVLHRELAHNPQFFVDVLCMVFRGEDEEPRETSDEERAQAMLGYRLLDSWHQPPGKRDDGTIDERELNTWVDAARALAADQRRGPLADRQTGRVLRRVPDDADGAWPNRVVRDIVERIESRELETGLELGLRNSRGGTSRGLTDGGAQERALQIKYLTYAQQMSAQWPRTAVMLRRIANAYREDARLEDDRAEISEDRWR